MSIKRNSQNTVNGLKTLVIQK